MGKRYLVVEPWREEARITTGPDSGGFLNLGHSEYESVTVVHEVADLYSERDDWTFEDGAHRVRAYYPMTGKAYKGKVYKRARTFKGETAWMDAERLYGDVVNEVRFRPEVAV